MSTKNMSSNTANKILIITRNFPPLTGGMEKLLFHTYQEVSKSNFCVLVGPKGCSEFTNNPQTTAEVPVKNLPLFFITTLIKSLQQCLNHRPSIIIGGSGIVAPIVVALSCLFKVKSIIFVHGLDIIAPNLLFQQLFTPFIRRATHIIANSSNTKSLAINKRVNPQKVHVIHPGVELPKHDDMPPQQSLRQKYKLQDAHILLSVGRLIPRKGLVEFIENSFVNLLRTDPEIRMIIIGSAAHDALDKQGSTEQKISSLISKHRLKDKIIMLGKVDEETLKNAYKEADLFIFPLVETPGDVEGFGMVALEAASFGLPVFAFDVGGVRDTMVDGETGFLVAPGNYTKLTKLIVNHFSANHENISPQRCIEHAYNFSWQKYGDKLRHFLESVKS